MIPANAHVAVLDIATSCVQYLIVQAVLTAKVIRSRSFCLAKLHCGRDRKGDGGGEKYIKTEDCVFEMRSTL
jgi:hypothetical protein